MTELNYLKNLSKRRLAEMWCELNRYQIPKELEDVIKEPNLGDCWGWMKTIELKVTHKACLAVWNEGREIKKKGFPEALQ